MRTSLASILLLTACVFACDSSSEPRRGASSGDASTHDDASAYDASTHDASPGADAGCSLTDVDYEIDGRPEDDAGRPLTDEEIYEQMRAIANAQRGADASAVVYRCHPKL